LNALSDPADLPDLNVWLALAATHHPHHAQAVTYWEQQASALLQEFRRQPGVAMAAPEHDSWDLFHALLSTAALPGRLHTDAYLAALAISHGWRLVSFDRDFKRFNGLNWLQIS